MRWLQLGLVPVCTAALATVAGCSAGGGSGGTNHGSGGSSSGGSGPAIGGGINVGGDGPNITPGRTCDVGKCKDFHTAPLIDAGAPANIASLFKGAPGGSGVCLFEPQDNSLFPSNWVRPRFRMKTAGTETLFEIRLHAEREANDLLVYTASETWTMPKEIWNALVQNAFDEDITVTVRATGAAGGTVTASVPNKFKIAPVPAGGSMVYWAADGPINLGGKSYLKGFGVGEEGTVDALTIPQVAEQPILDSNATVSMQGAMLGSAPGRVFCIGCHTSTPDGEAVAFNSGWPWNIAFASVKADTVGQLPPTVSQAATRVAQQPWLGASTFSPAHWKAGDRTMIASFGNPMMAGFTWYDGVNKSGQDRLAWFNMEATGTLPDSGQPLLDAMPAQQNTSFGFVARTGDARGAVNPDFSHDGQSIVYTSTSKTADGHGGGTPQAPAEAMESDIFKVPFNARMGGAATPIAGAADPAALEYYPDFSADDALVAFTRAPATTGQVYYRQDGEVWVVPSAGGTATRLVANDPPQCSGQVSPGVINSWPKWSPSVESAPDGRKYYWLVFSSGRGYPEQKELPKDQYSPPDTRTSQLYVTGLVVNGSQIETHSAIYIWNQSKDTTNLTPAWDEFKIPPVKVK